MNSNACQYKSRHIKTRAVIRQMNNTVINYQLYILKCIKMDKIEAGRYINTKYIIKILTTMSLKRLASLGGSEAPIAGLQLASSLVIINYM